MLLRLVACLGALAVVVVLVASLPAAGDSPPPRALAAAAAPVLVSPPAGATLNTFGPTLSWTNPPGTTQVHLKVVPFNNDGPGVDLYLGFPAASFDIPAPPSWYGLLPDITYTWSVRVSDATTGVGLEDPSWSPQAERTMRTPLVSSATISLGPPSNGGTVSSLTPTLQWANSRNDVFYYEVQVSKDPNFFTDPAIATAMVYWELRHGGVTVPPNSYAVPAGFPLENNTRYHWRVRPRVQGDGTPVEWSAFFSFTTVASAPGPTPPPGATPTRTPTPGPGATSTPTPAGTPGLPTATATEVPAGTTPTPTTGPSGLTPTPTGSPAAPTATVTRTPTVTPTRTPTPGGGTTGERVTNGNFEGSGGWSDSCSCITSTAPTGGWHSGSKGARLIPAEGSTTGSVNQFVSLPATGTSTLSYWFRLEGTDPMDDDCFVAGVSSGSTVLAEREHCVRNGYVTSWKKETVNLTVGGGTVLLTFVMKTKSSRSHENYALLDDVSVLVQ